MLLCYTLLSIPSPKTLICCWYLDGVEVEKQIHGTLGDGSIGGEGFEVGEDPEVA